MSLNLDQIGKAVSTAQNQRNGTYYNGIIIGRVLSIELADTKNLGLISYEAMFGGAAASGKALPLSSNVKHWPVIDEVVCIVTGPSYKLNDQETAQDKYYFNPYSIWRNSHHNKFPNKVKLGKSRAIKEAVPSIETITAGISKASQTSQDPLSDFPEVATQRSLQPYLGDVIMEGRWNNGIRFGSTTQDAPWGVGAVEANIGDPITIISNGYSSETKNEWDTVKEDINTDKAGIWMTSTQVVQIIDLKNFSLESFTAGKVSPDDVAAIPTLPTSYTTLSRAQQDRSNAPTTSR